jgi:hypothetical protein
MTKKISKAKFTLGRYFVDEKSLFKYLKKKEKEFEAAGLIQMEDYFDRFRVIQDKSGACLLIGNPDRK